MYRERYRGFKSHPLRQQRAPRTLDRGARAGATPGSRPRILGRRGRSRTPPGPEGSNGRLFSVRPGIVGRLVSLVPRTPPRAQGRRGGPGTHMSTYLVLARKYRPQPFDEMSGQEHVVRTLSNALKTGQRRPRLPVHRPARRRQDDHRAPPREGAQLREGADRRAVRRLHAVRRDRRGARGRRRRDRRRLEQRRRQRPRHREAVKYRPARDRLQGLHRRRGPHALAGRVQRAAEDARGAAAAREVHLRDDRRRTSCRTRSSRAASATTSAGSRSSRSPTSSRRSPRRRG